MPTRNLNALKEAADKGWADIDAGRFKDISDDQLEDWIRQLGMQAAACVDAKK